MTPLADKQIATATALAALAGYQLRQVIGTGQVALVKAGECQVFRDCQRAVAWLERHDTLPAYNAWVQGDATREVRP